MSETAATATTTADSSASNAVTATQAAAATTIPVPSEPGAWRSTLPEDVRGDASLTKYNDIPSLAKAHIELAKKLGEPKLPMPQTTWTEKEWGEFYSKVGRPDTADGYQFTEIKDVPPGLQYAPEQDAWFKQTAHKLGLSTAQAAALRDQFVSFQAERAKGFGEKSAQSTAAREAEINKLKGEYGSKWDASIDAANIVLKEFGGADLIGLLQQTGLDNDPRMIRFMTKLGGVLSDHSVITGVPRISGAFNAGPAAAKAELDKMDGDPETRKILTTAHHPQHDNFVKRRSELMRAMVPVDK